MPVENIKLIKSHGILQVNRLKIYTPLNHNEIINSYLSEWLSSKRAQQVLVGMWRKGRPHKLLWGMYIGTDNSLEVSQKTKSKTYHMIQQFHLLVYIPPKTKKLIWKDTCTPVFIAASFTIAKIQKQPTCSLADEWVKM